jgi:hypothetical protein
MANTGKNHHSRISARAPSQTMIAGLCCRRSRAWGVFEAALDEKQEPQIVQETIDKGHNPWG